MIFKGKYDRAVVYLFFIFLLYVFIPSHSIVSAKTPVRERLLVYVGAASKPPTEEAASLFEKKTGIKVDLNIGGSGMILSQMKLARKGDVYFPGSSDYMEKAKHEGLVYPETEVKVVYLVPAINVQRGNPKNIKQLKDLARPGLRVVIANPENVCVGLYAVEIVDKVFTPEEKAILRKNIVNYAESCEKTANVISLKAADAVLGWSVFEHWDPKRIETVPLKANEIIRIGYIPAAVSKFTDNRELAQRFIDFLVSPEGKAVYKKYNYFMTPDEAYVWLGAKKPVGGEYIIPKDWFAR
ncbi:MAG: molybdate ABC transporter substrate-binding protein [Nitrospirae bacterium]|nr:molybdate ABC transporter substrate-binding protein [Nitrospirota bacterium]